MLGAGITRDPSVRDAEIDQIILCGVSTKTQSSAPHCVHLVVTPCAVKNSESWSIVGKTSVGIARPLSVGVFIGQRYQNDLRLNISHLADARPWIATGPAGALAMTVFSSSRAADRQRGDPPYADCHARFAGSQ